MTSSINNLQIDDDDVPDEDALADVVVLCVFSPATLIRKNIERILSIEKGL